MSNVKVKIYLDIDGTEFTLTKEQALELRELLNDILGKPVYPTLTRETGGY